MSKEILIALVSGITAAVIGVIAQYAITVKLVESPKLALELRKAQLDAHRQILALSPIVTTTCEPSRWSEWVWKVQCATKSTSQYPVWIRLTDVALGQSFDPARKAFKAGQGFDLAYPQERKSFLATPNSSGFLEFFVVFRSKDYPNGINFNGLNVVPTFVYSVAESAKINLEQTFPELQQLIADVAVTPQNIVSIPLQDFAQATTGSAK